MRQSYHAMNIRLCSPLCVQRHTFTVVDVRTRVTDGPRGSHHGCHWPLGRVINSDQWWGSREQVGLIVRNQWLSVKLWSEQMALTHS